MAHTARSCFVVATWLAAAGLVVAGAPAAASDDGAQPSPPHAEEVASPPSSSELAASGAIGALAGAGAGFAVATAATTAVWGVGFLLSQFVPGPGAGFWAVYTVIAVTTPVLLVILPAIGAGLSSQAFVADKTDTTGATSVGVASALTTAVTAAIGGTTGFAIGGAAGIASAGGGFGQSAINAGLMFGCPSAIVGAGVGAALGAVVGGAGRADAVSIGIE